MNSRIFTFTVDRNESILTFLKRIKETLPWKKRIRTGKVRVNQSFVGAKYQLKVGQTVSYDPYHRLAEPLVNFDYQIIYQDHSLVVINKPTPLPIHPTGTYFKNTLVERLKLKGKEWSPLHRIDSETSGLLLLSRDSKLIKKWSKALQQAQKTYLVLVYGKTPKRFATEMRLERRVLPKYSPTSNKQWVYKKRGQNSNGKYSRTCFYRIKTYERNQQHLPRTLLFAQPKTGRTHQIRTHLLELGYPVVGDKIYGKDERYFIEFLANGLTQSLLQKLELPRQFLHAYKILITHPLTGKPLLFKSPLPKELKKYLNNIPIES